MDWNWDGGVMVAGRNYMCRLPCSIMFDIKQVSSPTISEYAGAH